MTVSQALITFCFAAGLLTITPGLDTMLVLRTAIAEGKKKAALAAIGIVTGCLTWGCIAAVGLGALLAASEAAFTVVKWLGAVYLLWLGIQLILRPRSNFDHMSTISNGRAADGNWLGRGYLTNLLNPKIGVFYVSFLPQFLPAHVPAGPFVLLLALLHALLGCVWFAILILATHRIAVMLKRVAVIRMLDRVAGMVFIAFGVKLALEKR